MFRKLLLSLGLVENDVSAVTASFPNWQAGDSPFPGEAGRTGRGSVLQGALFSIWLGRWASSPGLLFSRIPQSLVDPLSLALWAFAGHYSGMI